MSEELSKWQSPPHNPRVSSENGFISLTWHVIQRDKDFSITSAESRLGYNILRYPCTISLANMHRFLASPHQLPYRRCMQSCPLRELMKTNCSQLCKVMEGNVFIRGGRSNILPYCVYHIRIHGSVGVLGCRKWNSTSFSPLKYSQTYSASTKLVIVLSVA